MKPTEIINRTLKNSLKQLATTYPIVALMGPRQSGKTTLAKLTFPNFKYVTLEDLDTRTYAQEDPRDFLLYYSNGAIIDEIQRVPTLFSYIQTHVDKTNKVGQFILTGSQNFLLLEKITQSLAGRVALLKLLPLDLNELQKADFALESIQLEKLLFKGFYPKIHASNLSSTIWYSNYIQTYLERDVRTIKNIHDLSQFQLFLKMCAHRAGQLLNLSELGNECGINHNTVQGWLSILEASFIVYRLCPYYVNFNKRLTKMPKLYFYDTGLLCNLLNIQEASQISLQNNSDGNFKIFSGTPYTCSRNCVNFKDCCGGMNGWGVKLHLAGCKPEEKQLADMRQKNLCHQVGTTYCAKKVMGKCLKKKTSFCCFGTKFAKLLQEQGRPQLGLDWGTKECPNCRALTIEELTKMDLSKMDFRELFDDVMKKYKQPDLNNLREVTKKQIAENMKRIADGLKPKAKSGVVGENQDSL